MFRRAALAALGFTFFVCASMSSVANESDSMGWSMAYGISRLNRNFIAEFSNVVASKYIPIFGPSPYKNAQLPRRSGVKKRHANSQESGVMGGLRSEGHWFQYFHPFWNRLPIGTNVRKTVIIRGFPLEGFPTYIASHESRGRSSAVFPDSGDNHVISKRHGIERIDKDVSPQLPLGVFLSASYKPPSSAPEGNRGECENDCECGNNCIPVGVHKLAQAVSVNEKIVSKGDIVIKLLLGAIVLAAIHALLKRI